MQLYPSILSPVHVTAYPITQVSSRCNAFSHHIFLRSALHRQAKYLGCIHPLPMPTKDSQQ